MSVGAKLVAVDPGIHGALAFYDPKLGRLDVADMPTIVGRGRNVLIIDQVELCATLETYHDLGYQRMFIEKVGGMPGQSAPRAFNFGLGYGLLLGIARGLRMRLDEVRPQEWKGRLNVPAEKEGARKRASEILPSHAHLWTLKKHDGRAEAAMLAVYGEMVTRNGR